MNLAYKPYAMVDKILPIELYIIFKNNKPYAMVDKILPSELYIIFK